MEIIFDYDNTIYKYVAGPFLHTDKIYKLNEDGSFTDMGWNENEQEITMQNSTHVMICYEIDNMEVYNYDKFFLESYLVGKPDYIRHYLLKLIGFETPDGWGFKRRELGMKVYECPIGSLFFEEFNHLTEQEQQKVKDFIRYPFKELIIKSASYNNYSLD